MHGSAEIGDVFCLCGFVNFVFLRVNSGKSDMILGNLVRSGRQVAAELEQHPQFVERSSFAPSTPFFCKFQFV